MTTLPYRRQQVTPRSGGRTAGDRRRADGRDSGLRARGSALGGTGPGGTEYEVQGSAALQPRRRDRTVDDASFAGASPGGVSPGGASSGGAAGEAPRLRVAPPAPVSAPRAPFVALVLVLVVVGVLGILVLNTKINENAFKLQDLHDRQNTLNLQEQKLQQELAQQESPNSLAAAARQLGLVPADTPAFIRLPDGQTLGVPRPATGAQSASASGSGTPGGAAPGSGPPPRS
jgi:hypothetical protein